MRVDRKTPADNGECPKHPGVMHQDLPHPAPADTKPAFSGSLNLSQGRSCSPRRSDSVEEQTLYFDFVERVDSASVGVESG